jgi:hypothetical protein
MFHYWRLKIEGEAFLFSLALAESGSVGATKLSGRLRNERVGTALRAFAYPAIADGGEGQDEGVRKSEYLL